ncbi:putative mfs maltose permease [Golovinomyces cichoracearum]|uniref:Putative mfs maltose permease n=1 Tax=Golovinomyces cichoracearum TaxID=62708 RepID=A0A420IVD6_9PEZI|nr:putative mfs maltose permease [Golovinomyces cichoracearum]
MRPQYSWNKIFPVRSTQLPYFRRFFIHSLAYNGLHCPSRPQLSFLQARIRRPAARLISTETKEWIKHEVKVGLRYSILITATGFFLIVLASGIQEEYRARIYPTPDEWNWNTKIQFRAAKAREDSEDPWMKNWTAIGNSYKNVIRKLESADLEGLRIQEQSENMLEIPVESEGRIGFDISKNSESWRRGYYEVLMGLVRVAEELEHYVKDKTKVSYLVWLADSVPGPSNPWPRPVPVGMAPPPRADDCTAAFETPEIFYKQILTTLGFSEKQKVDTAISYGLWLEFKGKPDSAQKIYKWALDIANSESESGQAMVDPSTGIINNNLGPPSENILASSTALALHFATNSKVELALPIFISILRARRSLPSPPDTMLSMLDSVEDKSESTLKKVSSFIWDLVKPPKYPPPPSDGCEPPYRDAKGLCEEAGVMLYIGEILFASKKSKSNQVDGLAWTREAVDNSETELRKKNIGLEAKKKCKQCLEVGLQNWTIMIEKLAKEEAERSKSLNNNWLKFGYQKPVLGRWESEKEVIQDRLIRANSLLSET